MRESTSPNHSHVAPCEAFEEAGADASQMGVVDLPERIPTIALQARRDSCAASSTWRRARTTSAPTGPLGTYPERRLWGASAVVWRTTRCRSVLRVTRELTPEPSIWPLPT